MYFMAQLIGKYYETIKNAQSLLNIGRTSLYLHSRVTSALINPIYTIHST